MARAGGITNAVNVGIAVQADWENREFISHISLNVRRLFEFLLQFEATTKSKLASLNEKLDTLERRLELLEVQVGTASANPSLFRTNACLSIGEGSDAVGIGGRKHLTHPSILLALEEPMLVCQ
ncbi:protein BRICK 1 isoform X2 [Durio zibethinus]|uniref:Protein BRICK 1 isoform X2 n=1 Tax=Durio zibethinus TaxID=66656 RepID=A0A6P6BD90_DURZI|nr:protein BRICK 1 isoform X2 [Durio zibethinus]